MLLGVLCCHTSSNLHAEQPRVAQQAIRAAVGEFDWARPKGSTTRLPGGALVTTEPNTVVERMPDKHFSTGPGSRTHAYVYKLSRGRLEATIEPGAKSSTAVLVMLPNGLSGAVLQGTGEVDVDSNVMRFTARRRAMLVGQGEYSRQLGEGRTLAIEVASGGFHEVPVPKAPDVFLEHGLALDVPGVGFEATVRLQPDPDIATYQVALLRQQAGSWDVVMTRRTTNHEALLQGTGVGEYIVVARGFDRFGVESTTSVPAPFRTIGVTLPAGAAITRRGIAMGPKQQLQLLDASGLQMTYGFNNDFFVQAPDRVGMVSGKRTLVRLVDPGTQRELRLQLVPQMVKAYVKLGSATATWPKDRVEVSVQLVDEEGHALKSMRGYTAHVTINLQKQRVRWKRRGTRFYATIPPPRLLPGPWIVRVEVENVRGELVGRDFLEVVPSPAQDDD